MVVIIIMVTKRWLRQQEGRRRRQRETDARRGHDSGHRTSFTGCGNCPHEFKIGDTAVAKKRRRNGKRYCSVCAIRLGVATAAEIGLVGVAK